MPRWQQEPGPACPGGGFCAGGAWGFGPPGGPGGLAPPPPPGGPPPPPPGGFPPVPAGATLWLFRALAVSSHFLDLVRVGCW